MHFAKQTNPLNLLVSSSELDKAKERVEYFKQNGTHPVGASDDDMWRSRGLIEASFHPETGEKILPPFRFSAFVPMNILIIGGMIGARTIPSTMLWQGINQTYNVCVNHANRNASNPVSNSDLAKNYFAAVVSSVGTAVGLNEAVVRSSLTSAAKEKLLVAVPLVAVIAANICNIGLMRRAEMQHGIFIKDEEAMTMKIGGKAAISSQVN